MHCRVVFLFLLFTSSSFAEIRGRCEVLAIEDSLRPKVLTYYPHADYYKSAKECRDDLFQKCPSVSQEDLEFHAKQVHRKPNAFRVSVKMQCWDEDDDDEDGNRKFIEDHEVERMEIKNPVRLNKRYGIGRDEFGNPIWGDELVVTPFVMIDPRFFGRFIRNSVPVGLALGTVVADFAGLMILPPAVEEKLMNRSDRY